MRLSLSLTFPLSWFAFGKRMAQENMIQIFLYARYCNLTCATSCIKMCLIIENIFTLYTFEAMHAMTEKMRIRIRIMFRKWDMKRESAIIRVNDFGETSTMTLPYRSSSYASSYFSPNSMLCMKRYKHGTHPILIHHGGLCVQNREKQ